MRSKTIAWLVAGGIILWFLSRASSIGSGIHTYRTPYEPGLDLR